MSYAKLSLKSSISRETYSYIPDKLSRSPVRDLFGPVRGPVSLTKIFMLVWSRLRSYGPTNCPDFSVSMFDAMKFSKYSTEINSTIEFIFCQMVDLNM